MGIKYKARTRAAYPPPKSLLIGINYPGSSAELRGCINDVKRMKAYITSYDERVPGSSGKEG